jgi:hypothetical protein
MFTPSLTSWRAQHERLVRSRERVSQPYKSSVAYNDDLQHYFQDCWHLKDWIKNDPSSGVGAAIETEVLAHKALRVVGDLANGAKHLARHTHREGAYTTSTNVTVHLGQDKPIDVDYVVTLGDGTTMSAQALVHEAFLAWSNVLNNVGLKP